MRKINVSARLEELDYQRLELLAKVDRRSIASLVAECVELALPYFEQNLTRPKVTAEMLNKFLAGQANPHALNETPAVGAVAPPQNPAVSRGKTQRHPAARVKFPHLNSHDYQLLATNRKTMNPENDKARLETIINWLRDELASLKRELKYGKRPRESHKRTPEQKERIIIAVKLRVAGATYNEISSKLGVTASRARELCYIGSGQIGQLW